MSEFSVNMPPRLPAASGAANVLTAVVPDPPRHLTQMDNGTILRGTVQGRDNEGLLVVSTDKGVLKLQTPANLAPGSQVLLEVRATGNRLQVLVLSVEAGTNSAASGQTPPPASGSTGGTAPPPRAPPPATPVAIVGSLLQGTIVQAPPDTLAQLFRSLLPSPAQPQMAAAQAQNPAQPGAAILAGAPLAPASSGGASPGAAAPRPTQPAQTAESALPPAATPATPAAIPPKALGSTLQSEVQTKIESLFQTAASPNPGAKAGSIAATPVAARGADAQQAQASQTLTASLKLLAALPTGTEVKLRLIAISPGPGLPVMQPAAAPGTSTGTSPVTPHLMSGVMTGRIIGYTPTGHAVLHTPLGAIVLQGALAVPVGTELSFAIEPALPMPGGAMAAAPSLPQFLLSMSRGWPSLMEAIALMRQAGPGVNPNADLAAAVAHLPQPGPKLAAGLVAAVQALRSGNIEALLGGLAALKSGSAERDETARKLRQEFGQISNFAQDKSGVDWRCCFIPLLDDGSVRQINLFYRRDRGKDGKSEENDKSGTRFIVEVDMSKMGPFQFDGLVREQRFDLMVRSHVALTPKMREDIGALFQEALAIGDYKGNLLFQKVREFPVSPLEEIEKSATRVSA